MAQLAGQKYLTQKELAKRWRTSQSCVKNWRDKGLLPYFRLPASSRVLYPLKGIEEVESQHTKQAKGVDSKRKETEIKRKKLGISATKKKEWRV